MDLQSTYPQHIWIFADGASKGNPGSGGWGAIICVHQNDFVQELGGAVAPATNNMMELQAAISGLTAAAAFAKPAVVLTDSSYVIHGITKWISNWRRNAWRTSAGAEVLNRQLWEVLAEATALYSKCGGVVWQHVPGHRGVTGNERADSIADQFSRHQPCTLYKGSQKGYPFALADAAIPVAGKKGKPAAGNAYYLSVVQGQLARHATWSECEARVKGQSGARFKKLRSSSEEAEVLASWGFPSM